MVLGSSGGGGADFGDAFGMSQPVGPQFPRCAKRGDDRFSESGFDFAVADAAFAVALSTSARHRTRQTV